MTERKTPWTPGPWKWWTSNSWRRLKRDDHGITQNVLEPYVCADGHPDCVVSDADMRLIAAAPAMAEALERAERKLAAYVGVCKDDKELTETVLPIARAALAIATGGKDDD